MCYLILTCQAKGAYIISLNHQKFLIFKTISQIGKMMLISYTPLVLMPSGPLQPDLYCKTKLKNCFNLQAIKMEKLAKIQSLYIDFVSYKLNSKGGWVGGSVYGGCNKGNCQPYVHMTYMYDLHVVASIRDMWEKHFLPILFHPALYHLTGILFFWLGE